MQEYSNEERQLLETVRRISKEKLATRAEACKAEARFDRRSWSDVSGLGLTGATISAEFGGSGLRFGLMPCLIKTLAKDLVK